ncbi:MAG TPA: diaminopimelate decarboxylase [Azospirillaceae bacterium]|nr:diaminopimelate decarboxylase [Azospirillaceae bacterium]
MPQGPFAYRGGTMVAEGVPLAAIAEAVGTPAYVYSAGRIRQNYRAYADALAGLPVDICYAMKANANQAVLRLLAEEGAGADVVSGGELHRALRAGIPASRIVFSGVGKTVQELRDALAAGIHQINVESLPELESISQVASAMGVEAPVALRVNPDVDAETHGKISTGRKEDKFGIDFGHAREAYAKAASLPGVRPLGIAVHIGSQLLKLAPYRAAYARLAELITEIRADGLAVERLDLGGGLGVPYKGEAAPDRQTYAGIVRETVAHLGCAMTIEPGRSLVADAGVLLARVVFVKEGLHRRFLIVDAAMNDLIRPSLYEAWHTILPVEEPPADTPLSPMDVVGPVCETGDTFARQRELPPVPAGGLVAFMTAGAYGSVMASTYNSRPLVPEVLVDGDRWAVVRRRPGLEEMLALESVPAWMRADAG